MNILKKSQILPGRPVWHIFSPSQKHPNLHQLKIHCRKDKRSRIRGVAKIDFSTPALHGNHFFLLIRALRGNAIFTVHDTSRAKRLFFSFVWLCFSHRVLFSFLSLFALAHTARLNHAILIQGTNGKRRKKRKETVTMAYGTVAYSSP